MFLPTLGDPHGCLSLPHPPSSSSSSSSSSLSLAPFLVLPTALSAEDRKIPFGRRNGDLSIFVVCLSRGSPPTKCADPEEDALDEEGALLFEVERKNHGKRRGKEDGRLWKHRRNSAESSTSDEEDLQRRRLRKKREKLAFLLQGDLMLSEGKRIHNQVIGSGFEGDVYLGNLLLRMYRRFGLLEEARAVFDKIEERTVASWNAMIGAYSREGNNKEALQLYREMNRQGIRPDKVTFTCVLGACAAPEALDEGKSIHASIRESGVEADVIVQNAVVNMYAKCGALETARSAFDGMGQRTVVTWNTLIDAYSKHGSGEDALEIFTEMQQEGMQPDTVTFVCLLSACNHAGLVDQGQAFFASMVQEYGIRPTLKHYSCMIDLLARAGQLSEAEDMINMMPFEPDIHVWMSLLGACRTHGDAKRAELAAEQLFDLDPRHASPYVLLSNTYAVIGDWDGVERMRKLMVERNVTKPAGCSWIEIQNRVHTFASGDRSHPMTELIYAELERLTTQMREEGFMPDTKLVLQNVEDSLKEQILCGHSEKLAIGFGLISTPLGTTIRIAKNLRVCPDCHSATKFISKISNRKIIVRDVNRFHHFKEGVCSCGDYW